MPTRLAIQGSDFKGRGVIAANQRVVNLYGEVNPADSDQPVTWYQTPGLTQILRNAADTASEVRCLYYSTQGNVYAVIGGNVYEIVQTVSASGAVTGYSTTKLGTISSSAGPVRMQDNGIIVLIVDGSANGWWLTLGASGVTKISDPAFYGSNTIAFLDSYFILNRPQTNQWYVSPSNYVGNSTQFDPLYIVAKATYPDFCAGVATVGQTIWVFGITRTELWYDAGATDFPFQRQAGVSIDAGCCAPYSIAIDNGVIYWLSQTESGHYVVMSGAGYQATRISTYSLELEFSRYMGLIDDATAGSANPARGDIRAFCYQQAGHAFYVITFGPEGTTWAFDIGTGLWHQRVSLTANASDPSGYVEGRWRVSAAVFGYDSIFVGDYANGTLYTLDLANYTENGTPIRRILTFPHLMAGGVRASYRQFTLDMTSGNGQSVAVEVSRDRGNSWAPAIALSLGTDPATMPTLRRLGMGRDFMFRVSWNFAYEAAIQGAYVTVEAAAS